MSIARRPPTTSAGTVHTVETWTCTRCGETGPDRDDRPLPGCPAHPSGRQYAPHEIVYAPEAHHAAVVAGRGR